MKPPKRFAQMMQNLEAALEADPGTAGKIIADASAALYKVVKLAKAGPEWERFDILPTAGPRTGFMGRIIWQDEHATPNGRIKSRELCETEGGALVAIDTSHALDARESDLVKLHVAAAREDHKAQRAEIMAFWGWDGGASDMAKALKWDTAVWID